MGRGTNNMLYGRQQQSRQEVTAESLVREQLLATPFSKCLSPLISSIVVAPDFSETLNFRRKPVHNFNGADLENFNQSRAKRLNRDLEEDLSSFSGNEMFLIKQEKIPEFLITQKKQKRSSK